MFHFSQSADSMCCNTLLQAILPHVFHRTAAEILTTPLPFTFLCPLSPNQWDGSESFDTAAVICFWTFEHDNIPYLEVLHQAACRPLTASAP